VSNLKFMFWHVEGIETRAFINLSQESQQGFVDEEDDISALQYLRNAISGQRGIRPTSLRGKFENVLSILWNTKGGGICADAHRSHWTETNARSCRLSIGSQFTKTLQLPMFCDRIQTLSHFGVKQLFVGNCCPMRPEFMQPFFSPPSPEDQILQLSISMERVCIEGIRQDRLIVTPKVKVLILIRCCFRKIQFASGCSVDVLVYHSPYSDGICELLGWEDALSCARVIRFSNVKLTLLKPTVFKRCVFFQFDSLPYPDSFGKLQNLFPRLRIIAYDPRKVEPRRMTSSLDSIFSVTSAKILLLQMTDDHTFLAELLMRNARLKTFERILYVADVA